MRDPRRSAREREALLSDGGDRLLARAAEIDAAERARAEVARLRAAASEAGISAGAFDAALDEMRAGGRVRTPRLQRHRPRILTLAAWLSALILSGGLAVSRLGVPPAVPMVEQAFLLRCLAPGEAAELLRQVLGPSSQMIVSPGRAPRVLTVRTTPDWTQTVRTLLDREDGAACRAATTR